MMDRRSFLHGVGSALLVASARTFVRPARAGDGERLKDLGALLEKVRKEHDLPGLAAAVVRGGRVVAEGVAGVRQVGKADRITPDDRFLIGSCTKRMTAVMVGRVIDAGRLAFETRLADALPDVKMRDEYRPVTVAQLLTFTAGVPPYTQVGPRLTPILFELKGPVAERREQFVKHVLQEVPVVKPGGERRYSNASYVLAAFVASRRTGRTWEALMQDEVFRPLGLTRAGFGRPRSKEHPHEPECHIKGPQGYEPAPERPGDPAPMLAGAGGVHCSIRDFARFAAYELAAAQGKDALLKPATAKRWQELCHGDGVEGGPFFGGTPWLTAGYVLWPSKDLAAAVAVNGGAATDACKAVFAAARESAAGPAR